ncbi:hypothetical protein [Pseudomonas sp. efr-133-TYG-103a]|uniref:hypothetical protein n=1 Tax=Pseudomonas sp. efr-133-TYG-103a TaxID=3040308 RepID=UPI002555B65C|nr:hypothetical protein [Pseudomonas sp. efr-133-TYG-103a]
MPTNRIKVSRSTPSDVLAPEGQGTIRLTIDLDGRYSSSAMEAYLDAIDILNRVIPAPTQPSCEEEDEPPSLSEGTGNARSLLTLAKMLSQTLDTIITSGDWLTVHDLAALAGAGPLEFGQRLALWEADGRIFSFNHKGVQLFPSYALDPACSYEPVERLSEIITVLATKKDGWSMACWFGYTNSYLGGKAPKTLLNSEPDKVLDAARHAVLGIIHG